MEVLLSIIYFPVHSRFECLLCISILLCWFSFWEKQTNSILAKLFDKLVLQYWRILFFLPWLALLVFYVTWCKAIKGIIGSLNNGRRVRFVTCVLSILRSVIALLYLSLFLELISSFMPASCSAYGCTTRRGKKRKAEDPNGDESEPKRLFRWALLLFFVPSVDIHSLPLCNTVLLCEPRSKELDCKSALYFLLQ